MDLQLLFKEKLMFWETKSEAITVSVTRTATTGAIPIPLCPAAESEPPREQGQRC